MLHINKIRENRDSYIELLKIKNFDASTLIDAVISKDDERKATQQKADELLSKGNQLAKQIGELYKTGKAVEANVLKEESSAIKESSKALQTKQSELEKEIQDILVQIPNIPYPTVPAGKSDADNVTLKEVGAIPTLIEGAKPHWELTTDYGLIDFELGNKITGAGFPVYVNKGAKLQRALISYFLDKNTEAGYIEYLPPHLVNEASGFGTGQLPDKEGQMYHAY